MGALGLGDCPPDAHNLSGAALFLASFLAIAFMCVAVAVAVGMFGLTMKINNKSAAAADVAAWKYANEMSVA